MILSQIVELLRDSEPLLRIGESFHSQAAIHVAIETGLTVMHRAGNENENLFFLELRQFQNHMIGHLPFGYQLVIVRISSCVIENLIVFVDRVVQHPDLLDGGHLSD